MGKVWDSSVEEGKRRKDLVLEIVDCSSGRVSR